jgi:hypothetical protein
MDRKRIGKGLAVMTSPSVLVGLVDVVSVIFENGFELGKFPLQPFPVGVVIDPQAFCFSSFILQSEYHVQVIVAEMIGRCLSNNSLPMRIISGSSSSISPSTPSRSNDSMDDPIV